MKSIIHKTFFITLLIFGTTANAAFNLKPGLWEIQTKTTVNGKSMDATQKMNQAMQKMTPEEKKQMEKMMGSKGIGMGDKGMKVCHSEKESIEKSLTKDPKQSCTITNKKELADGIHFDLKCENSSGTAEYRKTSDNSYSGWNEINTKKGKTRTEFSGKFLGANCGDIKPLQPVR